MRSLPPALRRLVAARRKEKKTRRSAYADGGFFSHGKSDRLSRNFVNFA